MSGWEAILRRSWKAHFWTNVATTAVLTLSFGLILATILFTSNLGRILTVWGDEIQITIYLKDEITVEQLKTIGEVLKGDVGVERVQFIDKIAAQKSFEKSLSSYGPNFLKSLEEEHDNPFPSSFFVSVAKSKKTPEHIEKLAMEFAKIPGVEDVSYGQEWVKNYSILFRVIKSVAMICTMVLLIGCLFTVSNSIRASLASRREEIEILELVGATSGSIRKPFLVEGAFQGLLATLGALLLLAVAYQILHNVLEGILEVSTLVTYLSFLSTSTVVGALFVGTLIGGVGSYICVAQINSGWAAARERSV